MSNEEKMLKIMETFDIKPIKKNFNLFKDVFPNLEQVYKEKQEKMKEEREDYFGKQIEMF